MTEYPCGNASASCAASDGVVDTVEALDDDDAFDDTDSFGCGGSLLTNNVRAAPVLHTGLGVIASAGGGTNRVD